MLVSKSTIHTIMAIHQDWGITITLRNPTARQIIRRTVVSVTEVILARAPRALEGEVRGGSSLEGAGKGRLWRIGSRNGVD